MSKKVLDIGEVADHINRSRKNLIAHLEENKVFHPNLTKDKSKIKIKSCFSNGISYSEALKNKSLDEFF